MIPITFPEVNLLLAENQEEYETLPVCVSYQEVIIPNRPGDPQMAIITKSVPWEMACCFQLNKEEIEEIVRTGKLWYVQSVFGNNFQPMRIQTNNPFTNGQ